MKHSKEQATRDKRIRVFHPLLIGVFFPVSYLANNYLQLNPVEALRTILFSFLFAVVVFSLAALVIRDKRKAGIIASAAIFLFFTYGHVYGLFEDRLVIGHHRYLIPLWAGFFFVVTWLTLRARNSLTSLSRFFNYFSVMLLALAGFSVFRQALNPVRAEKADSATLTQSAPVVDSKGAIPPDVYYIILDTYARGDTLLRNQNFDNAEFLNELRQRGFYVAECSLSNYNHTVTSLASSLNMDYLENFAGNLMNRDSNFYKLGRTIKHSKVLEEFKVLGYSIVTFETGYWWLDVSDADVFITQHPSSWYKITHLWYPNYYEKDFLNTTGYLAIEEYLTSAHIKLAKDTLAAERDHYDRMLMSFDTLQNMATEKSPKFVYAHLIAPHFPYVFAEDGAFQFEEADDPGYTDQLVYVNQRILTIVDALIENSATPPVIVIQGDHGLGFQERNAILNAYYFPGNTSAQLYPTITPVNTFRLIFNTYFNTSYPPLPDQAWSSSYQTPFVFEQFIDSCETDGK